MTHLAVPLLFVLADFAVTGSLEVQDRLGDVNRTITLRYKLAVSCLVIMLTSVDISIAQCRHCDMISEVLFLHILLMILVNF